MQELSMSTTNGKAASTLRKWISYGIINRYLFKNFSYLIFKRERFGISH